MTAEMQQIAEGLVDAMLKLLREVGTLLARELDATKAEIEELKQHVAGLQDRVADLERP